MERKDETLLRLIPAPFAPAISFTGDEPAYLIRGQNFWLRSRSRETMYATAYKGSKDISETAATKTLTGTVGWNHTTDDDLLTGSGTEFLDEIRPGSMVLVIDSGNSTSYFFTIEEVVNDTQARVSRPFTNTLSGLTAYVLPIIYPMGTKRATQVRGHGIKYPRGHILAVGDGELRLNGQSLAIRQVETLTVVGTVSGSGNINVTVTAVGMTGTPKTVGVAVTASDTAAIVARKIATALQADADIGHPTTGFFTVTHFGADVILIARDGAANDSTMNIAYVQTTATGLTNVATSANTTPGNQFLLTKSPKFALYDPDDNSYTLEDYGITLPEDSATSPIITLSDVAGGTKNMPAALYGIRVVARSDANTGGTGGFSQPSANYIRNVGLANLKIRITFNKPMNVAEGQNAWDIYVTKYEDATSSTINSQAGPWYLYETVTAAQIAAANAVTDGRVTGMVWDIEFADGELDALDTLLSFDNFLPYDAEHVDLIPVAGGVTPIFFSCLGQRSPDRKEGTSPGPAIVVGKPSNPEAVLRDRAVSTFEGDSILGVLNVRGRHWLLCENTLQTAILTGQEAAPITTRTFWDVGFRNPYSLKFIKDYVFGFSTQGFIRSIGIGDTSEIDLEFSTPVDDYTTDWLTGHVLTGADPKNKAVCFFFSGKEKQSGYYVTQVLPFMATQGFWNPPILLAARGQRVSATVVGTAGATTNLPVTVIADGMTGSPKTINVAVTSGDTASVVAGKVRAALNLDGDVTAFFTVGGSGAEYTLTRKVSAAFDANMDLGHSAITGIAASPGKAPSTWVPVADFIVSGVATIGQKMFFLAGGRQSDNSVSVKTYEFDANDDKYVDCFAAWAFTDLGSEDTPIRCRGVGSLIGQGEDIEVEIHGIGASGAYDLTTLESGHGIALQTIELPDIASLGRAKEKRQNVPPFSKLTARVALSSFNGSGRLDELNLLINTEAGSRK